MENIGNYREKIQQKLITKFPGLSNWIYLTALAIYTLAMSLKGTMLVNFLITERGLFYLSAFPFSCFLEIYSTISPYFLSGGPTAKQQL